MPRECKLIRYCIRDARIRESVLNSVIGNRYYAPVKGGDESWRRKKKKRKKEGTIRGSFSAVPFLSPSVCYRRRFVEKRK